jgi:medium-chain acyl-[acyl-carrier-protein] hydrolase
MQKRYRVPFRVRSYEVDIHQKAGVSAICNYFQEAAGIHADHLNFDITHLIENGLTWVLYKMHVRIDRNPVRWQDIEVETWPSPGDGLRAFRDYILRDQDGDRMGVAVSQWMVLDLKSRRPVRIPKEILKLGLEGEDHTLEPGKAPLKSLEADSAELITIAGSSDLDMNNHVNNVKYIDWMTGYLPVETRDGMSCREIEIQYVAEAMEGDPISHRFAFEQKTENAATIRHTLFKRVDGQQKVIASAISKWR